MPARDIDQLIGQMTLDEKASLTAGNDTWSTMPIERLGIRGVVMTDCPNGARGAAMPGAEGHQPHSVCVPCGAALGATWDVELVERVGVLLGREARRKAARILLAPTVNLHRSPLGGRNFESYSEDPLLAGLLAAAYVQGVQSQGVVTTVKHFAGNESELDRMTADSQIDERTLRELYLLPFELAVRTGGSLGVMSSYNRLNGRYVNDQRELIEGVLRGEWGFEGFVVSDWFAFADTAAAAAAGLDLQMPGPSRFYGTALADAVRAGTVDERLVDAAASRLLGALDRIGALDDPPGDVPRSEDDPDDRALAREAAAAATVLLVNDGLLPFQRGAIRRLAVIGPNAARPIIMGGGSAQLAAMYEISPLDALRAQLGDGVEIIHEQGVDIARNIPPVPAEWLVNAAGDLGVTVELFAGHDLAGEPVRTTSRRDGSMLFGGVPQEIDGSEFSFRATAVLRPPAPGTYTLGLIQAGRARVVLDGEVVLDGVTHPPPHGTDLFGMASVQITTEVEIGPNGNELVVEYSNVEAPVIAGVKVAIRPKMPADALERAVAAAASADAAVLVVGTDLEWESEGYDRDSLDLPGRQAELIERVTAAQPATVVVVNSGSPVAMPWAAAARAVAQIWFGGQEMANVLVDVLFGDAEPGGRLPTTIPQRIEHTPSYGNFPAHNGVTRYAEGVYMGYRWYDTRHIPVQFAFGHGLSYTTFQLGTPAPSSTVFQPGDALTIEVPVTNTGARRGCEVVQLYVAPPAATAGFRPAKELKAFAKVWLNPGEMCTATLTLDDRSFAYWNAPDAAGGELEQRRAEHVPWTHAGDGIARPRGWWVEPGEYGLHIGRSSADIAHTVALTVKAG
jgi:beta-glucosidase